MYTYKVCQSKLLIPGVHILYDVHEFQGTDLECRNFIIFSYTTNWFLQKKNS